MIGIIDYGMGNLASVRNALDSIGKTSALVSHPGELAAMDKAILPGVGAFGDAMATLDAKGLSDAIREFALKQQKPFLGICLGMQLMYDKSHEFGTNAGLGLIQGEVLPLQEHTSELRVPNIGWCQSNRKKESRLIHNLDDNALCFYFVHSFFCQAHDRSIVTCTLDYGTECDAIIERGNLFACQFHPEKSQASGLEILKNFGEL